MVTVTSTGKNLRQPMLTYLHQTTDYQSAVDYAQALSFELNAELGQGSVVREKVEGRIDKDTNCPNRVSGTQYFEFHTKVDVTDQEEWQRLAEVTSQFKVPLLFNPDSKTPRPVTTYRHYDTNLSEAETLQQKLEQALIDAKFKLLGTTAEYSLYDTNLHTDQGWMFVDDPKVMKAEYAKADLVAPVGF